MKPIKNHEPLRVDDRPSRRDFIKNSSMIMAGSAVTGSLAAPNRVHAGAGDTLRLGLIGCGQRGTSATVHALNECNSLGIRVSLVAMADIFADRIHASLRGIKGGIMKNSDTSPCGTVDVPAECQFAGFDGYQRLLDMDLDLIVLASPPAFRPEYFKAAVAAGVHVFLEKPVAVDPVGTRSVLATGEQARQQGLSVAVGLPKRHEARYLAAVERLHDGDIGDILFARAYWNGTGRRIGDRSSKQSEMEFQLRNWQYFHWLSGDFIVEQHVQNLDVVNWIKDKHPVSCQGQGGRHGNAGMQGGDIFDHHMVEYTYGDGSTLLSQCRHIPGCWPSVSEHAHGTQGTANLASAAIYDRTGERLWKFGPGGGRGHQQQMRTFLQSIMGGDYLHEVSQGALSTLTAIMGRMATYSGCMIRWDDVLHSDLNLFPTSLTLDTTPPISPNEKGVYPTATPGVTIV